MPVNNGHCDFSPMKQTLKKKKKKKKKEEIRQANIRITG